VSAGKFVDLDFNERLRRKSMLSAIYNKGASALVVWAGVSGLNRWTQ